MLRIAPQRHTRFRSPIFTIQAGKRIPIHHRLGATAHFFASTLFRRGDAFSPILTFFRARDIAVLSYEAGIFALTAWTDAGEIACCVNGKDASSVVAAAAFLILKEAVDLVVRQFS
jgi:hypothetical protein